jgi:predicted RNA-binding protein associated with RNAse of E/G family
VASTPERVRIHYRRPPDREEIFEQTVLARTAACVVTFLESARIRQPLRVGGHAILEPGAPIVWFTFPGAWHDIGRFHSADGTFRGLYANVLTPVVGIESSTWFTTDLFLDVWQDAAGSLRVLDADELAAARLAGSVEMPLAERAEEEVAAILAGAQSGAWPPPEVSEWNLERAVEASRLG